MTDEKFDYYDTYQRAIIQAGSLEGAKLILREDEDVEEQLHEAMAALIEMSPEEMRPSWPQVIQWSRLQQAYQHAEKIGDPKMMLEAAKASSAMQNEYYK